MIYHKIYHINKTVCTAEQKIAYNYGFSYYDIFEKIKKNNNIQSVETETNKLIDLIAKNMEQDNKINKYNIDAIVYCLRYSITNNIYHGQVFTNYSDIGKSFPLLYDIE